jgi:Putative auto-transporter adhesin, head GIN domain
MRLAILFAAAALAAVPALAAAQTVVPADKFNAVELHGGGMITIRQGPVQRVTIIHGDPQITRVEVIDRDQGGKLIISPCRTSCFMMHNKLEVEVETPDLGAVGINGGGHIVAEGAFGSRAAVSAVIHGGGTIDIKAMPAQSASAAIHGGGKIIVAAQNSLSASISGGGSIRYVGQPAVSTSIHGGGSVDSLR